MEANQNVKGTETPNAIPTSQSVVGASNQDALDHKVDDFVQQVKANSEPKAQNDPDTMVNRVESTFNSTGKETGTE